MDITPPTEVAATSMDIASAPVNGAIVAIWTGNAAPEKISAAMAYVIREIA